MNIQKNILVCPLEWGLGHAGRMIPLIAALQKLNHNIIIGSGKEQTEFFKEELSDVTYIDFPGFRPRYSGLFPQYLILLAEIPLVVYHIIREHFRLRTIINKHKIDIVISDNRFGLWNRTVKTVYVTHQLVIPFPVKMRWLEWIGILLHSQIIKKYSYCFIPDLPGPINLSGRLSHGLKLPGNARYIGILSRFTLNDGTGGTGMSLPPHNSLILSGPDPQREILRKEITRIYPGSGLPLVILEGRPALKPGFSKEGNIYSFNHVASPEMKKVLLESGFIISRAGYTSIMELVSLNKNALLIPTPGQTEQEYLAQYMERKGWFTTARQKEICNVAGLATLKEINSIEIINESRDLLETALDELLK